jgi:DNA gyrase subunit B
MIIETLSWCERIRRYAGMYIGDTGADGALNLVLELVANVVDQHLAGRCTRLEVTLHTDGSTTITDDGPGIARDGGAGVPPLVDLFTRRLERPTVDGHRPHVHVGLGGAGLAAVCALSERLEVTTVRDGVEVHALLSAGQLVEPLRVTQVATPSGTTIRYRPDREIVHGVVSPTALSAQLEDLTYLFPRLAIGWRCEPVPDATAGLAALIRQGADALGPVAHHRGRFGTDDEPIEVEVALAWTSVFYRQPLVLHGFVNGARRQDPASEHILGLFDGIRAARGLGRRAAEQALVAAVSVVLSDVTFGNPAKTRLTTVAARGAVAAATAAALSATPTCLPRPSPSRR